MPNTSPTTIDDTTRRHAFAFRIPMAFRPPLRATPSHFHPHFPLPTLPLRPTLHSWALLHLRYHASRPPGHFNHWRRGFLIVNSVCSCCCCPFPLPVVVVVLVLRPSVLLSSLSLPPPLASASCAKHKAIFLLSLSSTKKSKIWLNQKL